MEHRVRVELTYQVYDTCASPAMLTVRGASGEIRTHDINLGKVAF